MVYSPIGAPSTDLGHYPALAGVSGADRVHHTNPEQPLEQCAQSLFHHCFLRRFRPSVQPIVDSSRGDSVNDRASHLHFERASGPGLAVVLSESSNPQHGCLVQAVCLHLDRMAKPFSIDIGNYATSHWPSLAFSIIFANDPAASLGFLDTHLVKWVDRSAPVLRCSLRIEARRKSCPNLPR